jgi:uncharacterized membrane protein
MVPPAVRRLGARVRMPGLVRREPLLFAFTGFAAFSWVLYSLWEYTHLLTEIDLSRADQAIWDYSRFHSPIETTVVPHLNALGDHFSPILALLTPFYWLWSDARILLVAQGLLIAAAIVPVFLFCVPRVGRVGAYLLVGAYAVFWGVNSAIAFPFHEVYFAPLLLALCLLFADRRRWTAFFVSLALLLLVKETMAILAVFIGLWLITGGERRRGVITAGVGVAWYLLAVHVFIPHFSSGQGYTHWYFTHFGTDAGSALKTMVLHPDLPFRELFNEPEKRRVLLLLFAPFLMLTLCSRLLLLCVPLIAEQLFATDPHFWETDLHYYLVIAVVLAMGAADGYRNLTRLLRRDSPPALAGALVCGVILVANVVVAANERWMGTYYDLRVTGIPLLTEFWPRFTMSPTPDQRAAAEAAAVVPDGSSVTVQDPLVPNLSERRDVYLLGYPAPASDYVVFSPTRQSWPDPAAERRWLAAHRAQYEPIFNRDGWIVWKRVR